MSQITGDSGSNVLTGTVFRDTIEGFGGDGITSASSHPELVSGDFGMPPRRDASITAMNSVCYLRPASRDLGYARPRRYCGAVVGDRFQRRHRVE